jgi:hypothetical protein
MAALLLLAVVTGRQQLGIFSTWGAFRDASPNRCFAIAEPVRPGGGAPFASVADWPDRGARNQVQLRLSYPRAPQARVTLSIGDRRFDLIANEADAWAPDTRTDQAIVAAMRSGRSMSVETLSRSGQPFADTYALKGAATAIDTATLACRG